MNRLVLLLLFFHIDFIQGEDPTPPPPKPEDPARRNICAMSLNPLHIFLYKKFNKCYFVIDRPRIEKIRKYIFKDTTNDPMPAAPKNQAQASKLCQAIKDLIAIDKYDDFAINIARLMELGNVALSLAKPVDNATYQWLYANVARNKTEAILGITQEEVNLIGNKATEQAAHLNVSKADGCGYLIRDPDAATNGLMNVDCTKPYKAPGGHPKLVICEFQPPSKCDMDKLDECKNINDQCLLTLKLKLVTQAHPLQLVCPEEEKSLERGICRGPPGTPPDMAEDVRSNRMLLECGLNCSYSRWSRPPKYCTPCAWIRQTRIITKSHVMAPYIEQCDKKKTFRWSHCPPCSTSKFQASLIAVGASLILAKIAVLDN